MLYGRIVGWGKAVPDKILTNFDLEKMVDTSDEWIVTRSGIRERRIAPEGVNTSTLSVEAGKAALEKAGLIQLPQGGKSGSADQRKSGLSQ